MNFLAGLFSLALLSVTPQSTIFVQDANLVGVESNYTAIYTDMIANAVRNSHKFEVLTNSDKENMAQFDANDAQSDSQKAIDTNLVLDTSVTKLGDSSSYNFSIKVTKIDQKKVLTSINFNTDVTDKDLPEIFNKKLAAMINESLLPALNKLSETARIEAKELERAKDKEAEAKKPVNKFLAITDTTTAEEVREKVGSYVTFGKYEQDANMENGPEPIQWMVIKVTGHTALLLSRYGLESYVSSDSIIKRKDDSEDKKWIKWVSKKFPKIAFTKEERKQISKKFLFTQDDLKEYLFTFDQRLCEPTPYAKKTGCNGRQVYYLGYIGKHHFDRFGFSKDKGGFEIEKSRNKGDNVTAIDYLIRPAIKVRLQ